MKVITTYPHRAEIVVLKGIEQSAHDHPSDYEECKADAIVARLKRKADANPEQPFAQILRTELHRLPAGIYKKKFLNFNFST